MNSNYKILVLPLFFLILNHNFSQSKNESDSLEHLLQITTEDSLKVKILNQLFGKLKEADSQKTFIYATEAVKISEKINHRNELSIALENLGYFYDIKGEYQQAIPNYNKALELNIALADTPGVIHGCSNLGFVYSIQGDYSNALKIFFKGLNYAEKFNYLPSLPGIYNNIGELNRKQKNSVAAEEFFLKAVNLSLETGNKKVLAHAYNNLGIMKYELKKFDNALEYFFKSLKIKEENGDKQGMASTMNNIGEIYMEMGKYPAALDIQLQAIGINEETEDKEGLAYSMVNIGKTYFKQNNLTKALESFKKGASMAKELGVLETLSAAYIEISNLFKTAGDFKNAYEYHQLHMVIKDSLYNYESHRLIAEMQGKYNSEKKEKEIEILQKNKIIQEIEISKKDAEAKKQNIQKIAFGVGFVLVMLLALVFFKGLRNKQRANLILSEQKNIIDEKNFFLEKANGEVRKQKEEIEEKNSEILSSIRYAQRIQEALLPSQNLMKSFLENYFVLYKPKDIVAGDFFWVAPLPTNEVSIQSHSVEMKESKPGSLNRREGFLFAVGDCTGHGVPGAFVSIVARNALNRAVKEFALTQPALILDKVNELVDETFSKNDSNINDGMDIALCKLSFGDNKIRLEFAGANNEIYIFADGPDSLPPQIIPFRQGRGGALKADKQPIGKYSARKSFTNNIIEFPIRELNIHGKKNLNRSDSKASETKAGITIYLFSDGFADQFGGPRGKKFKYSQLENLLFSIQDKALVEQKEILNNTLEDWKGVLEQVDDVCVLGVKI